MTEIKYHLAEDTVTKEERYAWAEWIKSEPAPHLTMGLLVKHYEEKWSNWVGRKYSVACNSGSSANLLMAYTLLRSGQLKNKKVIVPSTAWVTSISPFMQLGFEPIMCEADPNTWGLNPEDFKSLVQKHKPGTVMMVQVLGVPNDMDFIMSLKEQYDFFLLEDACAAMGSSFKGAAVGTFGDMASVSTFYGHQFSTLEGGIVSTDDKKFYEMLLMLRSHGWVANLDPETKDRLLQKYEIEDIGTNFVFCEPGFNVRLTDAAAFLGIGQLEKMDWLVQKRFENHQLYKKILSNYFQTQEYDEGSTICSIHFCALAKNYEERNFLLGALVNSGISTRPFTSGNQGRQPYWFREYGKFRKPVADQLYECGFFLPNHPHLKIEDIEHICSVAIKAALGYRKGGK